MRKEDWSVFLKRHLTMTVWRAGPSVWRKFEEMARGEEQLSGSLVPKKYLDFFDIETSDISNVS